MSINAMKQALKDAETLNESLEPEDWAGDEPMLELTERIITALRAAIEAAQTVAKCDHIPVTTFGGDFCIKCNEPMDSNEYPKPAPDGMVLVKRSDLIATSNKTLVSSCGVCRSVSFALEAMLAADKEMK